MKYIFLFFLCQITHVSSIAQTNPNHVYVKGYVNSNGDYVKGYYRTVSNETINDNFSTRPNVNPYTGKVGEIEPETQSYYLPPDDNTKRLEELETINKHYADDFIKRRQDEALEDVYRQIYKDDLTIAEREALREKEKRMEQMLGNSKVIVQNNYTSSYLNSNLRNQIAYHDKYSHHDKIEIERFLKANGFFYGVVDGIFSYDTIQAIKQLQHSLSVPADGKLGEKTLSALGQ